MLKFNCKKNKQKFAFEQNKLSKMVDEFKAMSDNSPEVNEKWDLLKNQRQN